MSGANQQWGELNLRTTTETQLIAHMAAKQLGWMKRHPIWSFLWILGLFIMTFVRGVAVDPATQESFFDKIDNADDIAYRDVREAALREKAAYENYYYSKGWFSCDARCQANYEMYQSAQNELKGSQTVHSAALSDAKATVGIFSQFGVQETRKLFWDAWERGKAMAKRMSFWDVMFVGMRSSRDDTWMEVALRLLMRIIMNFTIGMSFALIGFLWSLWNLIWTYKAGIAGLLFFFLAGTAACSMLATFLLGLYSAGTLVAFTAMKHAALTGNRGGGRRGYRRGGYNNYQRLRH